MRFDPLAHPIAWSPARFLVADPSVAHVPFAMVLVDLLSPRTIVELGTTTGLSYCAFLQAANELALPVRAVAVPARMADGRPLPSVEHCRLHHDTRYNDVSSISLEPEPDVRRQTGDASVDLLCVQASAIAPAALFEHWQPKLGPRGAVVLCGLSQDGESPLDALWAALSASYPSFRLTGHDGIGVVAVGGDAAARLAPLVHADPEARTAIERYFMGLGAALRADAGRVQAVAAEKDAIIAERDEAVSWLRSELALVRRSVRLLEQRADWYALQLETIFASRSWRWLARYRRLRERLGLRPGRPLAGTARHPPSLDHPADLSSAPPDGVDVDPISDATGDPRRSLVLLPRPRLDQMSALFDQPAERRLRRHVDVICLAIIDWEFRFQRPQQIATQFAAHGHRVFYVSPARYRRGERVPGVRELADNIYEVELGTDRAPDIYGENIGGSTAEALVESLGVLRQTYDISSAVLFTMISSWTTVAETARGRWQWPVIYDCMDEWENFQGIKSAIVEAEQRLVRSCDLLVVTAARLEAKWAPLGRPMVLARNAADVEFYASRYRPNTILTGLTHPIVGYYGAIADWFDLDLMVRIARERPHYRFVLLGGVFGVDVSALSALPNVSLLGQQPYATMPLYLYHFDVCLIPFKVNPITEATDPVKLYEYLSAGKPVVSVDLPELAPCREHIYVAADADDFLVKLDQAVAEDDRARQERRRAFVAENTWAARYQAIRGGLQSIARRAAIVIVTYNNLALTRLCLESILQNTDHPNYEVIVVDNASTDGTPAYLRYLAGADAHVKIVLNPTNNGFARANNQGLALTDADDLVLLNNDTVVPHGWLTRLVGHLRDEGVGLVGPVTNFVGNEARIDAPYHTWGEMEEFAAERARRYEGQIADISMLAMFCVAMTRETFNTVGPLDEQFGVGMFEDDDYARRVEAAGLRIVCAADTFVHHVGQAAFKVLIERGEYDAIFEENRRRYEAKWGRAWKKHENKPLPFAATTYPPPAAEPVLEDA